MNRAGSHGLHAENAGLAFAGASVPAGLIVETTAAKRMLGARNPHGKPNADVLRPYVDAEDLVEPSRDVRSVHPVHFPNRWIVDFPADLTPEEGALYPEPWRIFRQAHGVLHARADPMRIAIARIDSYLAAPLGRAMRGFARIDSAALPGAGLCVVATEDDLVSAVLQSGVFAAWAGAHGGRLRVKHVASFPFPWPPRTELGALSRAQLELRDRVVRAGADDLDDAVAAAYGWRDIADEEDLIRRLTRTHDSRR